MANNICFKFEVFKFAKEELKRTLIKINIIVAREKTKKIIRPNM